MYAQRPILTFYGLQFSILPLPLLIASLLLWLAFALLLLLFFAQPAAQALLLGAALMLMHHLGEVVHNLGHALAARRSGFPMCGVRLWGLGTSVYPEDEPALPPRVHIQRALGGPLLSTLFGLLLLALASTSSGAAQIFLLLAGLENVLIFGPGALTPLHLGSFESDGATILRNLRAQ